MLENKSTFVNNASFYYKNIITPRSAEHFYFLSLSGVSCEKKTFVPSVDIS